MRGLFDQSQELSQVAALLFLCEVRHRNQCCQGPCLRHGTEAAREASERADLCFGGEGKVFGRSARVITLLCPLCFCEGRATQWVIGESKARLCYISPPSQANELAEHIQCLPIKNRQAWSTDNI